MDGAAGNAWTTGTAPSPTICRETTDDEWQPIDDDVVRLVFTACHPVLSREARSPSPCASSPV